MHTDPLDTPAPAAPQQPDWADDPALPAVRRWLTNAPPLVRVGDTDRLRELLARVAAGEAQVVLAGDCSEDPAESGARDVAAKAALLDLLAGTLGLTTRKPVIRAGRIAGQFAKPRSRSFEVVNGRRLPSYRGHMVNSPEPDPRERRPDPHRMRSGYLAARSVMQHLGWTDGTAGGHGAPVWTAHEALLLDYELPMLRRTGGRTLLASTHWPWLGERTRDADGEHAALLARAANPVACKIGPSTRPEEVRGLCRRLDPDRVPGRLTLVARMGAGTVTERLPPLVEAVRRLGHDVVWLCDPMHGNTVSTPSGLKTRFIQDITREVREFQSSVRCAGGVPGGLHLETTPEWVTECVPDRCHVDQVTGKYTSHCDPRLNPEQAAAVAAAWSA
ncbi:3-deoxy-7-phosphoheptulonate synthase [Nocardiopsis mangrovi]|uniref:Phospho-2-dehydro-3-deoxyheptonate aldolase n=1 Tax=Nocardiopsis mangrovi TaxID=1179818 RepID=A0ABV9DQR2_9ACTN